MNKPNLRRHTFTYNGQQLEVIFANGGHEPYDAETISDYYQKNGRIMGTCGFSGYSDGAIIVAPNRTFANMIHRFMNMNSIPLAKMQGD